MRAAAASEGSGSMERRGGSKSSSRITVPTYAEIAEAVEALFGKGSMGIDDLEPDAASEDARAAFVRASILLVVKGAFDIAGLSRDERALVGFKASRAVRNDIAVLLGVDENEVFRLHHHAAGRRAQDAAYRSACQYLERSIGKRHGMHV